MAGDYEKLGVFYLGREHDPQSGQDGDAPLLYDSRHLTTHAVCLGMTGSGKTGLCIALLEEAGIDGVPAICIDPKGDLANLLLTFPELRPADFEPWIDPAEAARKGKSVTDFAASTAETWRKGLADWDESPERIASFRDKVDLAIYTPGARTGLPLSILRSLSAPPAETLADTTALRDRIGGVVGGLLGLAGRDADPLQSREHILLATILEQAWSQGRDIDLAGLIGAVQRPPIERIGALDLETFYPSKERTALALALNNLLASPGFSAWLEGEPLDAQRLLWTDSGKPRISIISIAHLSDAERMFAVTLILNEVVSWMRRQSGTSSLRAILYMDEVFSYFPPTANPPSKAPMLTLLKQARAFGVGCVLATQNPVDLDYKGLGNAGTWLIGRLQTDRDKQRVLDGLESALPGGKAGDRATLDKLISSLAQRVFLLRDVNDDQPVLMRSRWALSYLRGPLTGPEISKLMAGRKAATPASSPPTSATSLAPAAAASAASTATAARTPLPGGIRELFEQSAGMAPGSLTPHLLATAKLHYVDAKSAVDEWQTLEWLVPIDTTGTVDWTAAREVPASQFAETPAAASSSAPPAKVLNASSWTAWKKELADHLYETARRELFSSASAKLAAKPGESEGEFRARLAQAGREARDAAVDKVEDGFAAKRDKLLERIRKAEQKLEREKGQLSEQRTQTAVSIGSAVLGAFFGRKKFSTATIGRASTAARRASRAGAEAEDVDHAEQDLGTLRSQLEALEAECKAALAQAAAAFEGTDVGLERRSLAPRKSDIRIVELALAWAHDSKGTA